MAKQSIFNNEAEYDAAMELVRLMITMANTGLDDTTHVDELEDAKLEYMAACKIMCLLSNEKPVHHYNEGFIEAGRGIKNFVIDKVMAALRFARKL